MTGDKTTTSTDALKGSVKEAIGKLTGDTRMEIEGEREKRAAQPAKARRPVGSSR